MTETTKRARNKARWFTAVSTLLNVGPVLAYVIIAIVDGHDKPEGYALGAAALISFAIALVNVIFKYHLRSPIWMLVLGIHFVLQDIQTMLVIIAVCTLLDEFIFSPVAKNAKDKLKINKEIDKRMVDHGTSDDKG